MVQLQYLEDIAGLEIKSLKEVVNEHPQPWQYAKWLEVERKIIEQGKAPSLSAWLLYEYQFNHKFIPSIAAELGISNTPIINLMKRMGIPLRDFTERVGSLNGF